MIGLLAIDHRKVLAAGMAYRPLAQTLRDTLDWHVARGAPDLTTGLAAADEGALLRAWADRKREPTS